MQLLCSSVISSEQWLPLGDAHAEDERAGSLIPKPARHGSNLTSCPPTFCRLGTGRLLLLRKGCGMVAEVVLDQFACIGQ